MIEDALRVALRAHEGQTDLQGRPYIFHVLRVMVGVERSGGSDEAVALAALHDVKEDGELMPDDGQLRDAFGARVVDALEAITKKPGEEYQPYIERVATDELAVEVKLADLEDNMDPRRTRELGRIDLRQAYRLANRYRWAKKRLLTLNKES